MVEAEWVAEVQEVQRVGKMAGWVVAKGVAV
jgi:hypothetical protein